MARGHLVQVKKLIIDFPEYTQTDLDEIPELLNQIRALIISVHSFGGFNSTKSFNLEVVPGLKFVKILKLNVYKTYLKGL